MFPAACWNGACRNGPRRRLNARGQVLWEANPFADGVVNRRFGERIRLLQRAIFLFRGQAGRCVLDCTDDFVVARAAAEIAG